ncbi:MAG: AAA family ATPase [Spiribacter salinus]|uniref:AAA family ATPase n=1 Tax=Spiribacter salinus TaxID=1335746 RepID=A0A540VQY6_9GAMM|nr:MAG: AAA family ATPase [Spiribacter salinus]
MSGMNNIPSVNQTQLLSLMSVCAAARRPLLVWGSPGIGKSDLTRAFAEVVEGEVCDIRLAQYDAVDIRGLPDVSENRTIWHPPSTLPLVGNDDWSDDKPIVLFLDEILQAAPAVQSVAFQLVLERRIGEHELKPNVLIFAASNRETDRAGVQKMLLPLANRFMHVNLEPSLDAWKDWALASGVDPMLVAYLNFRPDMLDQFDEALKAGTKAFPTPRAWHAVSDVLAALEGDPDLRNVAVSSIVGEGVGAELAAFLRSASELPSWTKIIEGPESIAIPDRPDMMYALVGLMANRVDPETAPACITLAKRLPQEYAVMWMADVSRRKRDLVIKSKEMLAYQTELHHAIYG